MRAYLLTEEGDPLIGVNGSAPAPMVGESGALDRLARRRLRPFRRTDWPDLDRRLSLARR